MTTPSYILPLLLSSSPLTLLHTLSLLNNHYKNLTLPLLNRHVRLPTLVSASRFNLKNLTYTQSLRFALRASTALTDSHPLIDFLANNECTALRVLDLQDAKNISDEVLAKIVRTQWRVMEIRLPPQSAVMTFTSLKERPSLTHLSLQSSLYLSTPVLGDLASTHTKLTYLNIAMTRPEVRLPHLPPSLKSLDIRYIAPTADIHALLEQHHELEFIAIAKIHREINTQEYIAQLIRKKSLQEIVIYNDNALTPALLAELIQGLPNLKKLNVHRCFLLTKGILEQESTRNWGCKEARHIELSCEPYDESSAKK